MFEMNRNGRWFCGLGIVFGTTMVFGTSCVHAQITPDGTLPNNSIVTPDGNTFNITGGTIAGGNLFHSFREFSVPTAGAAIFNNALNITNVISRVTGGSISTIDGLIRTFGSANLFFINPNGIIFGQNARLDVGGSFVASTASAIEFGNQGFFSATNPEAPPLLTINPSALFFNQRAQAEISNSSVAPAGRDPAGTEVTGLKVPDGQSLLLVGGDVNINGGSLRAYGGRVELAAIKAPGTVGLNVAGNTFNLNIPQDVQRANVSLSNGAQVNVGAANGGSIAINAQNVNLAGNSSLRGGIATGLGTQQSKAGDILINAKGEINLTDDSFIANLVQPNAVGLAGDINITTDTLILGNDAILNTSTFGKGSAGNVIINARGSVSFDNSYALSTVERGGEGKGGDIQISANFLSLTNGAQLEASTRGIGAAGNVLINARGSVSFDNSYVSAAFSTVEQGVGKGGNLQISAETLSLTNGAQLQAQTSGVGDAGNVIIDARGSVSFDNSYALSTVERGGEGKGGDIQISAETLSLINGAQLTAATRGIGAAGNVLINARGSVSFDGMNRNGIASAAFSTVEQGVGKGGNLQISAETLSLTNGAQLQAQTSGVGDAGNVIINARGSVSFDNSNALSTVERGGEGKGGDIQISAETLSLTNGAQLTAATRGIGAAGNVLINARGSVSFDGMNRNGIASAAFSTVEQGVGKGGFVQISAETLSLTNGAQLQAQTSGVGDAGNVIIDARGSVSFDNSYALSTVERGGEGKGGDIQISAETLSLTNGAQLTAATRGIGAAGNVLINARGSVSFDGMNRNGIASAAFSTVEQGVGKGGFVQISANSLSLTNGAQLQAQTSGVGDAGNVLINARGSVSFDNSYALSTVERGGEGKGGDIQISAETLSLTNGAQLTAATRGIGAAGNVLINARGSVSFDGMNRNGIASAAFSTVEQTGEGKGGFVQISANSLSLTNGAVLTAFTSGVGDAGNIEINASDSVNISGTSSITGRSSALGTATTPNSTGIGGDITVNTPNLRVSDGAVLDARTENKRNGGNITLNVRQAEILNGGQLISTSSSAGNAGKITVNATDRVIINGSDSAFNDRVTQFPTSVPNRVASSGLFVLSESTGSAGNIEVTAPQIRLDSTGRLNAESTSGNGGNINLNIADLLLLRRGSQISTSAGIAGAGGDGGNITINASNGFIVAIPRENSDITANAFLGTGGRIRINTSGLYGIEQRPRTTSFSDITASSEQGIAGIIAINIPDVEQNLVLLELPIVDPSDQIAQNACTQGVGSEFIITGRGGLPPSPNEDQTQSATVVGLVESAPSVGTQGQEQKASSDTSSIQNSTSLFSSPVVPAQGWVFNDKGDIVLTAHNSTVTKPQRLPRNSDGCPAR